MGVYGSGQKANSHGARSSVQNIGAQDKGALESTKLQSRDQYFRGQLHLTCGWQ